MSVLQDAKSVRLPELGSNSEAFQHLVSAPSLPIGISVKRLLDILGASVALILCAPVMLLLFLGLGIIGNPIFKQYRVGRGGKLFACYKFRSMVNGAEQVLKDYLRDDPVAKEEWMRTYKLANDPRITPLGRFLRKSSLDELPQLFNVLMGDMSLVGPRPIVPAEVPRYRNRIRAYHGLRPGITGLWQVSGRNLVSYRRRVALDSVYAREHSVGLDMLILLKTVAVVFVGHGAL